MPGYFLPPAFFPRYWDLWDNVPKFPFLRSVLLDTGIPLGLRLSRILFFLAPLCLLMVLLWLDIIRTLVRGGFSCILTKVGIKGTHLFPPLFISFSLHMFSLSHLISVDACTALTLRLWVFLLLSFVSRLGFTPPLFPPLPPFIFLF